MGSMKDLLGDVPYEPAAVAKNHAKGAERMIRFPDNPNPMPEYERRAIFEREQADLLKKLQLEPVSEEAASPPKKKKRLSKKVESELVRAITYILDAGPSGIIVDEAVARLEGERGDGVSCANSIAPSFSQLKNDHQLTYQLGNRPTRMGKAAEIHFMVENWRERFIEIFGYLPESLQ
jgi:hypothetical protein